MNISEHILVGQRGQRINWRADSESVDWLVLTLAAIQL
jgi:hypothetical protein